MPAPTSALKHHRRLLRIQYLTLAAVRRAWRRLEPGGSWERQYRDSVGPQVAGVVVAAQVAATRESDTYIAEVLNELDFGPLTEPGVVLPNSLAGVAGDGRPVESLLTTSVGRARAVAARTSTPDADTVGLESAEAFMDSIVQTILADSAREAELVAMAVRPWVDGYVRVAEPGACSRCIVLAGKFYLFNDGFLRHPSCRCYHLPAPKDRDRVKALIDINSPQRYFDALTEEEQNRIFTEAGAEAIREGADIARVVNARRGMRKAQMHKRDVLITMEATTRRGRRRGQQNGVRLMPESIAEIAGDDREEFIRLLRLYGYLA